MGFWVKDLCVWSLGGLSAGLILASISRGKWPSSGFSSCMLHKSSPMFGIIGRARKDVVFHESSTLLGGVQLCGQNELPVGTG